MGKAKRRRERAYKLASRPHSYYFPREFALRKAEALVLQAREQHPSAYVRFSFSCSRCKVDCTFQSENAAPKKGLCHNCGFLSKVTRLHFEIYYSLEKENDSLYQDRKALSAIDSGGDYRDSPGVSAGDGTERHRDESSSADSGSGGLPDSTPSPESGGEG